MTIGKGLNSVQINADMAAAADHVVQFLRLADQLQEMLVLNSDASLTAAAPGPGYTQAEVNIMRSAFGTGNDGPKLAQIIRGQAALAASQDFRTFIFQMCGDCVG